MASAYRAAVICALLFLLTRESDPTTTTEEDAVYTETAASEETITVDETEEVAETVAEIVQPEFEVAETVTYQVLDKITRDPIAGATVQVERTVTSAANPAGKSNRLTTLRTNSRGQAQVQLPPLQRKTRIALYVMATDYVPIRVSVAQPTMGSVAPILLERGVRVTGQVVDENGDGVSPAKVYPLNRLQMQSWWDGGEQSWVYRSTGGSSRIPVSVDGQGRFTTYLTGRLAAVQAEAPGYAPGFSAVVPVQAEGITDLKVLVTPGYAIRGRVISTTGDPIEGAVVRFYQRPGSVDNAPRIETNRMDAVATSDADGNVEFENCSLDFTRLTATHPEYLRKSDWNFKGKATDEPFEIEMEPGQWVTLRPVDPNGKPLNAKSGSIRFGENSATLEEQGDGTFRSRAFEVVHTKGVIRLSKEWADQEVSWAQAGPGERALGDVIIEAGPPIRFVVRDGGSSPIVNASVRLTTEAVDQFDWPRPLNNGKTDKDGKVTLTTAPGVVKVAVTHHDFVSHEERLVVGVEETDIEITLSRGARIVGTVLQADGSIAISAQARAIEEGVTTSPWTPRRSTWTDPLGRFALDRVRADHEISLAISHHGSARLQETIAPLQSGETRDVGELVLDGGFAITGRVVDESGRGVAGATVSGEAENYSNSISFVAPTPLVTQTENDGSFMISGMEVGTYSLNVTADGYMAGSETGIGVTEDGETAPITVELAQGVAYAGVVRYEDGSAASGARVNLTPENDWRRRVNATTDSDGRFELAGPPKGSVRLSVSSRGVSKSFNANTISELPTELVLATPAELEIELRITGDRQLTNSYVRYDFDLGGRNRGGSVEFKNNRGVLRSEAGSGTLTLQPEGFPESNPVPVELVAGQTKSIVITIDGSAKATEVVVVDSDGKPLAGASVRVADASEMDYFYYPQRNQKTDAEGVFLTYTLSDSSAITVEAVGFARFYEAKATQLLRGNRIHVKMAQESAFVVDVFNADGSRAQGVEAYLKKGPGIDDERGRYRRMIQMPMVEGASSAGIRLGKLVAGNYTIAVQRNGLEVAEREETLGTAQEKNVEIRLGEPVILSGIIRINGEPASRGEVGVGSGGRNYHRSPVSSEGRYTIELPGPGSYRVAYYIKNFDQLGSEEVEVNGDTTFNFDFETTNFEMTFLLPNGDPAVNLRGALTGPGNTSFATDASGKVVCESLPAGEYTCRCWRSPPGTYAPRVKVVVPDETGRIIQLVEARQATFRINTNGNSVPYATVFYVKSNTDHESLTSFQVENTAEVAIPNEMTTGYVQTPGHPAIPFTIPATDEAPEIVLDLRVGGTVKLEVADSAGEPFKESVTIEPRGNGELAEFLRSSTLSKGKRTLYLLPGSYRISAQINGSPVSQDVVVVAGQEQEVRLQP